MIFNRRVLGCYKFVILFIMTQPDNSMQYTQFPPQASVLFRKRSHPHPLQMGSTRGHMHALMSILYYYGLIWSGTAVVTGLVKNVHAILKEIFITRYGKRRTLRTLAGIIYAHLSCAGNACQFHYTWVVFCTTQYR